MLTAPVSRTYSNLESLILAVNEHDRNEGYAIVKERTKKRKNHQVYKIYLKCDPGGIYIDKSKPGQRTRDTGTRLTGCPFSITANLQEDKQWLLEVCNSEHNHPPIDASGHSVHRQLKETAQASVANMTAAGIEPRQIRSSLRLETPESLISARDVYNSRAKIRRDALGSRTAVQALLEALLDGSSQWTVAFKLNPSTNQVTHLFFAHAQSIHLMKSFPEVLFLDFTYKTNWFEMPLLVMIGTSYLNTTFYLGFAFLAEEIEENYIWAREQVRNIYNGFSLYGPEVVVTDRDIALLNALNNVLPQSPTILYPWHINKNILTKASSYFQAEGERTAFMLAWGRLVNTTTGGI